MVNATTGSGRLSGGRLLTELVNKDPRLGQLLQTVIDGVNTLATNTASSAVGSIAPPKAPDSIRVSVGGEYMHVSHSLSGPIDRGIQHITEVSTTSSFAEGTTITIDHGCSRTSHPFPLPTQDANGNTLGYFVRGFAQYPGSQPSEKYTVGGSSSPTKFTMTGTTQLTLQPSHGSGTGPNTGKSGQGLGFTQKRTE
jgi:hypothetical protein